jgi:hypothetical protein
VQDQRFFGQASYHCIPAPRAPTLSIKDVICLADRDKGHAGALANMPFYIITPSLRLRAVVILVGESAESCVQTGAKIKFSLYAVFETLGNHCN